MIYIQIYIKQMMSLYTEKDKCIAKTGQEIKTNFKNTICIYQRTDYWADNTLRDKQSTIRGTDQVVVRCMHTLTNRY